MFETFQEIHAYFTRSDKTLGELHKLVVKGTKTLQITKTYEDPHDQFPFSLMSIELGMKNDKC